MAVVFVLASGTVSHAQRWHGRGRGGHAHVIVGVGPLWWSPLYPYPYGWPYPYPYPPPYAGYPGQTVVVQQEPPVYVEQRAAAPSPAAYWYYCPSARAYYPDVQACPEAWITVPPR
jgi:hypothetical protein